MGGHHVNSWLSWAPDGNYTMEIEALWIRSSLSGLLNGWILHRMNHVCYDLHHVKSGENKSSCKAVVNYSGRVGEAFMTVSLSRDSTVLLRINMRISCVYAADTTCTHSTCYTSRTHGCSIKPQYLKQLPEFYTTTMCFRISTLTVCSRLQQVM